MRYGPLITEALRVTRHHRYLWFFGLFAGVPSFNSSFQYNTGSGDGSASDRSVDIDPALILGLVALVLVLVLAWTVLSAIAQGALVRGVVAAHQGERPGFRAAWRAGRASFWRVLGVGILGLLVVVGLLLAVAAPLAGVVFAVFTLADSTVLKVIVAIPAALIGVLALVGVGVSLAAVIQYAFRVTVLQVTPVVESLRSGWQLFRHHLGSSLLMLLIQQAIAFGAAIVILIAAVVLSLPAIVLLIIGTGALGIAVAALTALVVIPSILVALGALGTLTHGFWTLAYLQLSGQEAGS